MYNPIWNCRLLAMAGLMASTAFASAETFSMDEHGIYVSGTGSLRVAPDIVMINLAVEAKAKTADAARASAADAMSAVQTALHTLGVQDNDLQTRWVTLNPVYAQNSSAVVTGYEVRNDVTVRLHDLGRTGDVVDNAVKAAGDRLRIEGLRFAVDNPAAAESKARELAVADAVEKAKHYATLAGVKLGHAVRIIERAPSGAPLHYVQQDMRMRSAEAAATPVQAGEQEIAVTVDAVFTIE